MEHREALVCVKFCAIVEPVGLEILLLLVRIPFSFPILIIELWSSLVFVFREKVIWWHDQSVVTSMRIMRMVSVVIKLGATTSMPRKLIPMVLVVACCCALLERSHLVSILSVVPAIHGVLILVRVVVALPMYLI